jgi:DNA (cytosine-5)-methyltransferase 1
MENVPELARHSVFLDFVRMLKSLKYEVSYTNVYCPAYGIPQQRTRLVLFASLNGTLSLPPSTHRPNKYRTVKQAIFKLPPLSCGDIDPKDPLHRASQLSSLNLRRMRASRPGGYWRDWPKDLIAECHQAETGKTYPSVYGRMEWDRPAPTITTQFFGFGNGRFGHPDQDRAISLREGSILQSFPRSYRFCARAEDVSFSVLGRLIGNAVPVRLGEIIGKTILKHIAETHA